METITITIILLLVVVLAMVVYRAINRIQYINNILEHSKRNVELKEKVSEQADTIKRLNCRIDESHIVVEALANTKNKKDRLDIANKYIS